jgi:hypothetical protein
MSDEINECTCESVTFDRQKECDDLVCYCSSSSVLPRFLYIPRILNAEPNSIAITRCIRVSMVPEKTLSIVYATEHNCPPIGNSAQTVNTGRVK